MEPIKEEEPSEIIEENFDHENVNDYNNRDLLQSEKINDRHIGLVLDIDKDKNVTKKDSSKLNGNKNNYDRSIIENANKKSNQIFIDELNKSVSYGCFEFTLTLISLNFYLVDIYLDIQLTSHLYRLYITPKYGSQESYWWFILTALLIIFSHIINSIFSYKWLLEDDRSKTKKDKYTFLEQTQRIVIIALHLALLGPLYRFVRCIYYGWKFRFFKMTDDWKRYYLSHIVNDESDLAILNAIAAFLEAAPQLVLQLYIMIVRQQPLEEEDSFLMKSLGANSNDLMKLQGIKLTVGILSISWALVSFQIKTRIANKGIKKFNKKSMAAIFVSNIFITAPRTITLSLFASYSKGYIFCACFLHWLIMVIWHSWEKVYLFNNPILKWIFKCVMAFINLFSLFLVGDGNKRYSYIFCCTLMYTENVLLILLWYNLIDHDPWYSIAAVEFVILGFWVAIPCLIIHYKIFHPKASSLDEFKKPNCLQLKLYC